MIVCTFAMQVCERDVCQERLSAAVLSSHGGVCCPHLAALNLFGACPGHCLVTWCDVKVLPSWWLTNAIKLTRSIVKAEFVVSVRVTLGTAKLLV